MSVPSIRRGMTVGFFGIGRSNLSLLRCLWLRGARVNLRSDVPIDRTSLPSDVYVTRIYEGAEAFSELCEDVMFFSPSVRREREELAALHARGCIKRNGEVLISDSEIAVKETHNLKNLALAAALTDGFFDRYHFGRVARSFTGLAPRYRWWQSFLLELRGNSQ